MKVTEKNYNTKMDWFIMWNQLIISQNCNNILTCYGSMIISG